MILLCFMLSLLMILASLRWPYPYWHLAYSDMHVAFVLAILHIHLAFLLLILFGGRRREANAQPFCLVFGSIFESSYLDK